MDMEMEMVQCRSSGEVHPDYPDSILSFILTRNLKFCNDWYN